MERHGDPRFYKLLEEMAAIHSNKNHDYATNVDPFSNFRKCEVYGIPAWKGCLTRMSDKWSRLEQIASGKEPKNESLNDTLMDLAVYSLICLLLVEERGEAGRSSLTYDDRREYPVKCMCGRLVSNPCGSQKCGLSNHPQL